MQYIPLEQLKEVLNNMEQISKKELLRETINKYLNKDVSEAILKRDSVPDEYACVETLCLILREVLPDFPLLTYTPNLVKELKKNINFIGTLEIEPLSIIVNATGSGNGTMTGHTGFIWDENKIASNDSRTGLLRTNYTIESWKQRFRIKGGMPTLIFKLVDNHKTNE